MAFANPTVDTSFIILYEPVVKQVWQDRGSRFMNSVRLKRNVIGNQVRFPLYGAVEANQKAQHGEIVPLNPAHTNATTTAEDWYAPIFSDTLDELKTNIDERREAALAGAKALGRRADLIVTTALQAATQIVLEDFGGGGNVGLNFPKIRSAIETLDDNVVDPDDRWGFIGTHQWQELQAISEFANADFVGASNLTFPTGVRAKEWNGITWVWHPSLPVSGGTRSCYIFHKQSVGLAINKDITFFVDWVPKNVAFLINHFMAMGAIIIEQEGVVEVLCDDDATIT